VKAIRIDRQGGPDVLVLADVERPAPQAGEVLVRQTAIGVNYIDVYIRTGLYPRPAPFVLGSEGAGTVEAVGAGVTAIRTGDRVGYCGSPKLGAYAEYNAIPAGEAVPRPDGITLCRAIRAQSVNTPCAVMILTARASGADKALGLESGADDYPTKPFSVRAMVARVGACLLYQSDAAHELQ